MAKNERHLVMNLGTELHAVLPVLTRELCIIREGKAGLSRGKGLWDTSLHKTAEIS